MRQVKFVLHGTANQVFYTLKVIALIAPNVLVKDLGK
jgi:hypothetical protein